MPTLNKQFSLAVTPEQFINACSDNEIRELHLLLNSKRFDSCFPEDLSSSGKCLQIPENYQAKISKQGIIGMQSSIEFQIVFDQCVKLFGEDPQEAIKVISDIVVLTGMPASKIIPGMPLFKNLEALRVKHLVQKPQDKIEEKN